VRTQDPSRQGPGSPRLAADTTLYVASSNPGKLREFREAAALRSVSVEPMPHLSQAPACFEDGSTFEANARKKAIHYSRGFSGLVFADDSGLCVDALGGAPGVYSARYAGPDATDEQNNVRLLTELHRLEAAQSRDPKIEFNRAAHYVCAIALARSGQVLATVEGRVDGVIVDEPRGSNGFGYDPYFFYPPYGKTLAEVTAEEKFAVSHRGIAFRSLLDALPEILG